MILWILGRELIEEGALVPGREDSEFGTCEVIPGVELALSNDMRVRHCLCIIAPDL